MSKENRPNLNAVGLTVDIMNSLRKHIRGPAGKATIGTVFTLLESEVRDFVEKVDEHLNQYFGTGNLIDNHIQNVHEHLDVKENK
jgi:hypothetical protein